MTILLLLQREYADSLLSDSAEGKLAALGLTAEEAAIISGS